MQIGFVLPDQHEALVDLMHEMCVFYGEEAAVDRDDVRSNLVDNLLAPESPVRLSPRGAPGTSVSRRGAAFPAGVSQDRRSRDGRPTPDIPSVGSPQRRGGGRRNLDRMSGQAENEFWEASPKGPGQ